MTNVTIAKTTLTKPVKRAIVTVSMSFDDDDGSCRVQYYASMVRHCFLVVLALSILVPVGCKKPPAQKQPVVVHVFRDLDSPYAHELDHRILEFQASVPRLASGAPIVIKTYSDMDYKSAIQSRFDKDLRVEVVILDSPADAVSNAAMAANLSHAVNICAAVKACPTDVPAFVAPSATGPEAEAGQIFVQALAQHK